MKEKKLRNSFKEGAISATFIGDSIAKHSTKLEIGAHSIFLGQVRKDIIENKEVLAIEYSAHTAMAEEAFYQIREDMFKAYNLTCLHIYHSLGKVNAGEICLFVFTSSKHRQASQAACNEIVERIKKEVPIWGKEIFNDDSYQWKSNVKNEEQGKKE